MIIKQGHEDNYLGERFITFSEASEILSLCNCNKISKIVREGLIQAYELPNTDRLRLKKSEVIGLISPNDLTITADE